MKMQSNLQKTFIVALGAGNTIESAFEEGKKQLSEASVPDLRINEKIPLSPHYEPRTIILSSLISAFIVIFIRILGGLQGLELGFYDHLQSSWSKSHDDRLLMIEVTNEDIQKQQERGEEIIGSFSNKTLAELLEKLKPLEPAAIGLDVYREGKLSDAVNEEKDLKELFEQSNLFTVCKLPEISEGQGNVSDKIETLSVSPPPNVSEERIGFSDFIQDSDTIIRRQLLAFDSTGISEQPSNQNSKDKGCRATESLSLKLANAYLQTRKQEEIKFKSPKGEFCKIIFPNGKTLQSLHYFTGGYQGETNVSGCQVLLKYRIDHESKQSAEAFTVQEVLDGELQKLIDSEVPSNDPDSPFYDEDAPSYKGRVILIGIARKDGYRDYWNTPL